MSQAKTTKVTEDVHRFACMRMKELCNDERPREKLLEKGAATLSNAELIAIMLRTGTGKMNAIDLAREVIKGAGGTLNSVSALPLERLCGFSGIGPGKAATLVAAFELGRRAFSEDYDADRQPVSNPRSVFRLMIPHLKGLDHEECWVLFLNRANRLTGKEKMSSGGLEATVMDCKSIVRRALEKKASSVILVHNHPSGNALPGSADIRQTEMLRKALATCDIGLTDHLVIADSSYYSFADEQLTKAGEGRRDCLLSDESLHKKF